MRASWRFAPGVALALACTLAPAQAVDPDWRSLLRAGQLAQWLGQPLSLEAALCIEDGFGLNWPEDQARLRPVVEDRLHRVAETCLARPADEPTRLLVEGRKAFQQRLARLQGRLADLRRCRQADPAASALDCARRVAGSTAVNDIEARWLAAAAASSAASNAMTP